MEIVLALGSALAYGGSDFLGGLISRRLAVLPVIFVSQLVSFALVLAVLPFWAGVASSEALLWGAAAGVAGIAGTAALFRGFVVGRMGVVAPISGVLSAGIPVVAGLTMGERPGVLALAGIAIGLVAVAVVSRSTDGVGTPGDAADKGVRIWPGAPEGAGAGIGFGVFFVLLERTPADSGLWPFVGVRASIILVALVAVLLARRTLTVPRATRGQLVGLGALNGLADLLFLLATRQGLLSLVAVITSLYPAGTVILARTVLSERISRTQGLGLLMAALSVVLIASGR